MLSRLPRRNGAAILLLPFALLALAGCGSSKSKSSSSSSGGSQAGTLSISLTESGKAAKYSVPSTTKGGLVSVTLDNKGKAPHGAQLALIQGNHTPEEALKAIGGNNSSAPEWLRAEGGVGTVLPGKTGTATVVLPPGKYVVADPGGPGSSGPPAHAALTVTGGSSASATLPSTPTTITAATAGKNKYKWQVSGSLKAGENKLTFASKGKDTLHFVGAFRVTGNPSKAAIVKAMKSNGPPPPFVDQKSFTETAALDGGKSLVSSLTFAQPGKYVLFCPLADRDEKTPHFAQGLLTTVDVK